MQSSVTLSPSRKEGTLLRESPRYSLVLNLWFESEVGIYRLTSQRDGDLNSVVSRGIG